MTSLLFCWCNLLAFMPTHSLVLLSFCQIEMANPCCCCTPAIDSLTPQQHVKFLKCAIMKTNMLLQWNIALVLMFLFLKRRTQRSGKRAGISAVAALMMIKNICFFKWFWLFRLLQSFLGRRRFRILSCYTALWTCDVTLRSLHLWVQPRGWKQLNKTDKRFRCG